MILLLWRRTLLALCSGKKNNKQRLMECNFRSLMLCRSQRAKVYVCVSFRWRPEINSLLDQLATKISQGSEVKKVPVKTTKPQEFSLTKPKPQPLPEPEIIPQQEKCKPVSLMNKHKCILSL